jgi:hypothetical protein
MCLPALEEVVKQLVTIHIVRALFQRDVVSRRPFFKSVLRLKLVEISKGFLLVKRLKR